VRKKSAKKPISPEGDHKWGGGGGGPVPVLAAAPKQNPGSGGARGVSGREKKKIPLAEKLRI